MHTFFHDWRRKLGAVTLVVALMVMVVWARSYAIVDSVEYPTGPKTWDSWTCADGIISRWAMHNGPFIPKQIHWTWWHQKPAHLTDYEAVEYDWGWSSLGVGASPSDPRNIIWKMPLWLVAFPLTLLSAYLILWKPRKRGTLPG